MEFHKVLSAFEQILHEALLFIKEFNYDPSFYLT